jgi:capsular polysaccharide biosynthesis protein
VTLAQLVRSYRRRWATIALGAGLGLLAALGYLVLTPASYEARAQLFVTTPDAAAATGRALSYARLAASEQVLTEVIDELDLPLTTADLAARVRGSSETGTVLIDIRARDDDAARARDIANAVGTHLPVEQ